MKFKFLKIILVALTLSSTAHATVIYESATMGPNGSGGFSLNASQFLASRFTLSETYTITGIGGHIDTFSGSVWGAIVELPSALGLPSFSGLDIEVNSLASALFEDNGIGDDFRQPVNVTLGAGEYALIFGGAGLFGSTGSGAMPTGGQVDLPGSSYFFYNGGTWFNGGFSQARFVVEGFAVSVPEPSSIALLLIALFGLRLNRRNLIS